MSLRHTFACGGRLGTCFTRNTSAPTFTRRSTGCRSISTGTMAAGPFCSLEDVNKNVIKLEYAVRGPLVIRAGEIAKELAKVSHRFYQKSHLVYDLVKVVEIRACIKIIIILLFFYCCFFISSTNFNSVRFTYSICSWLS